MLNKVRAWGIVDYDDLEVMAQKMTEMTWTLCAAFRTPSGTVWANDSITEDSLQEYAVLRPAKAGGFRQVESFTISWCDAVKLRGFIEKADADEFDEDFGEVDQQQLESSHEGCRFCW